MRIVGVDKLEDCFDGSAKLAYRFDAPWTEADIKRLRAMGTVDYFPDFPRPFFRLRGSNGLQVKGVEGERDCQVFFPRTGREVLQTQFESLFETA